MSPGPISFNHPKYRPDIDGLRALAVLAVVAFHAFPNWVRGGFIGVDIFFVISGYLISTIIFANLDQETFSFTQFYARRIRRIFPALILVLSFCFALGWFTLLAEEYKQLGKHIAAGAGFVSNLVLWNEAGYFDAAADTKPLLHLWSLGIEEQFYIAWPLLLWIFYKRKLNLLTITILFALISFALNMRGINEDAVATFYLPQTRFWELLCGSTLAWLTLYKKSLFAGITTKLDALLTSIIYSPKKVTDGSTLLNALSWIGLIALVYGFWRINRELSFPGKWALVPVLGAVFILLAGPNAWINRNILANKVTVWIGLISYPLYLWHWPLISFARIIEGELPSRNIRIAAVMLAIALAWFTYLIVERPLRFGKHSKVKTIILVLLMTIVGYVGYNTYERNGLGFRAFNKTNETANEALQYDWKNGFRYGECFINNSNDKNSNFSASCSVGQNRHSKTIMIWGDSHAASLYAGFEKYGSIEKYSVLQFTTSGCPPVLDFYISNRKECENLNNKVFSEIRRIRPDVLVMAANWEMYNGSDDHKWENYKWEDIEQSKLLETLKRLKALDLKQIILIGQLPVFSVNQVEMLKRKFIWDPIKNRTYKNFKSSAKISDVHIKKIAANGGVSYISPLDILCDPTGCLISIPGKKITPLSYDYGHLNADGSEYLVSEFFNLNLINISK